MYVSRFQLDSKLHNDSSHIQYLWLRNALWMPGMQKWSNEELRPIERFVMELWKIWVEFQILSMSQLCQVGEGISTLRLQRRAEVEGNTWTKIRLICWNLPKSSGKPIYFTLRIFLSPNVGTWSIVLTQFHHHCSHPSDCKALIWECAILWLVSRTEVMQD